MILLMIFLALAAAICAAGIYIARKFVYPRCRDLDTTWQMGLEAGEYTPEDTSDAEAWELQSAYGYILRGVMVKPPQPRGVVVLCHGHRHSWHGTIKYWRIFRELGYVICAYNHRFHGDSGGENCSAGWFEARDLQQVITTLRDRFPDLPVGLLGESMGGAAVLQFMELGDPVDFIIADCPYSSMEAAYRHQLSMRLIPPLLHSPIIAVASWYIRIRAGFSIGDVSALRCSMTQDTPVLLVHGDADSYIPMSMSEDICTSRRRLYPTELLVVPEARHADAWRRDPREYTRRAKSFILDAIEVRRVSGTPVGQG